MRRLINIFIAAAICGIVAASCTVKEDRTPCPTWLNVDVSLFEPVADSLHMLAWGELGHIYTDRVALDGLDGTYENVVNKGTVISSAVSGVSGCIIDGDILTIRNGSQYDRVFAHVNMLECVDEFEYYDAVPHKQHAVMKLKVIFGEEAYPFSFVVTSDVCGMSLKDLSPAGGAFRVDVHMDGSLEKEVVLPRQYEDGGALRLDIYKGDELMDSMGLASILQHEGYDWTAVDLADIEMVIDFADTDFNIGIKDWESGDGLTVII